MKSLAIVFFANLKELTGIRKCNVSVPDDATILNLKEILGGIFPAAARALQTSIAAVNHEFASDNDTLMEADEVAFFPPVSGGSLNLEGQDIFWVTEDELDVNRLLSKITKSSTGAICLFTGVVRGSTTRGEAHETNFLEYEAYIPMAEEKMRQVAKEIRSKWSSIESIAIVQRIGVLYPGTPTVLIACSAAHRDTGVFEAARYGIDRLKEIVPIWKKEVGPAGESWVEGEYFPKSGE